MSTKVIKFEIIDQADPLYATMRAIIEAHHLHLLEARIVLAWKHDWQPASDGTITLGKCKKAADLDRLLHDYDFVILLNSLFWDEFTPAQQRAILDHEITHAAVTLDDQGKPKQTEDGRLVYRVRKHDLEEFREIVERHGLYRADLEAFAQSLQKARDNPLFADKPVAGKIGQAS